jgi:hypothetical protein
MRKTCVKRKETHEMRRDKLINTLSAVILFIGCSFIHADVLELKSGSILNGKYVGGSAGTVRFETEAGLQVIETGQIIALTFAPLSEETVTRSQPASGVAPPTKAQSKTVTLPSGTTLIVRMTDNISSHNKAGTKFTATLEYDLPSGDVVALKGGTKIYGKVQSATQARRAIGRSTLDIRLTQLIIDGKPVTIATSSFKEAGKASIAKAARGAAAGAIIGGIADGSDGAKTGAAIGATAGALKKGQTISIPSGSLLEFNLTQPITLTMRN